MADNNGRWLPSRDQVKFWVLAIGLVFSVAASWYRTEARVDSVCDRLDKVEAKLEAIDPTLIELRVAVSAIQTDMQWVRNALADIQSRVTDMRAQTGASSKQ